MLKNNWPYFWYMYNQLYKFHLLIQYHDLHKFYLIIDKILEEIVFVIDEVYQQHFQRILVI